MQHAFSKNDFRVENPATVTVSSVGSSVQPSNSWGDQMAPTIASAYSTDELFRTAHHGGNVDAARIIRSIFDRRRVQNCGTNSLATHASAIGHWDPIHYAFVHGCTPFVGHVPDGGSRAGTRVLAQSHQEANHGCWR
jgi:hypothetical protein